MQYHTESDSLGSKQIPAARYYGVQTERAIENFKITGIAMGTRPNCRTLTNRSFQIYFH